MTEINPLAGAILASPQTQRQLVVDREKQVRRAPIVYENASGESEEPELEVESPDIVTLVGDGAQERGDPERHLTHHEREEDKAAPSEDEDAAHIDITG